ncbi:aromatic ring-hydroxylating dioxygenase subunit alpha [Massilia sp. METH4]|uniref:aromatic ring-hydroxylating dioxygenase subunit alpha n=1 Tax=Massilia sp. METH4 TaxID=3123041 RepID=UPI0030CECFDE
MSKLSARTLQAVQKSTASMANRSTEFIYNEWYVAAFVDELKHELLPRTLLGKRLVLFRTEQGQPVALTDRCAHRAYPLSRGALEGDTVVCGYHGFRYDANGDCVDVPSAATCPKGIGVQNYKLVERGQLVWIWMGDPALADETLLRDQAWLESAEWQTSKGYFDLQSNYVSMHENLLDLTHLSFLHAETIGTPDYAKAPFRTELKDGYFALHRDVVPTTLPPVWATPTGLVDCNTAARIVTSEFKSPAFHQVNVSFYDSALPEAQRNISRIKTAHLLTPQTHSSSHYFIIHGRDFAQDDEHITEFMHENLFAAFYEDVDGLAALEQVWRDTDPDEMYEMSVGADGPSVAMRRYLKRRADAEQQARAGAGVIPIRQEQSA